MLTFPKKNCGALCSSDIDNGLPDDISQHSGMTTNQRIAKGTNEVNVSPARTCQAVLLHHLGILTFNNLSNQTTINLQKQNQSFYSFWSFSLRILIK